MNLLYLFFQYFKEMGNLYGFYIIILLKSPKSILLSILINIFEHLPVFESFNRKNLGHEDR